MLQNRERFFIRRLTRTLPNALPCLHYQMYTTVAHPAHALPPNTTPTPYRFPYICALPLCITAVHYHSANRHAICAIMCLNRKSAHTRLNTDLQFHLHL